MKLTPKTWVLLVLSIGILISGGCITQKVLVITGNEPVLRQDTESERVLGTIIQTEIEGQTDEETVILPDGGGADNSVRTGTAGQ